MSTKTNSPRHAPIDMGPEEFRALGHRLVDQISEHLRTLPDGPVTSAESPSEIRSVLKADRPLPDEGADAGQLLGSAAELLFGHSLFNGHPRFLAYITSSAAPIGILADFLASAVNQNVGSFNLSPMATEIEAQTIRWIAELVGFPAGTGGVLVSGGNMANFVCILAARVAKAGPAVRTSGLAHGTPRLAIYASSEAHTWIQKAADLFGFGTDSIRWITVDAQQRMSVPELRRQIQVDRDNGTQPFFIAGTAGSVSTGAVDPLQEIGGVAKEFDLWFHVDGAYGALAVPVAEAGDDLRALSGADSVAVDPHKWLYAPLEAGCALVRRPEDLRNAFAYHPSYYHFNENVLNYVDYGMQNSRGFRALKVWLALQHVGRAGYRQMIAEDMRLARSLHQQLLDHPEFEAMTQSLSITTFRYVPVDLRPRLGDPDVEAYLNRLNEQLLRRVEKSGQAFLSNAVIGGKFALRACIVNFRTSLDDVTALPGLVAKIAAEVDGLRASGSGP